MSRSFVKTGLAAGLLTLLLTGCGEVVEVPPAHVGKKSSESGLQKSLIQPSKFRLEFFCITCDKLILAEASDYAHKEPIQVFMPEDELNMQVDVRGVYSISSDEETVNSIFSRLTPDKRVKERVTKISMSKVYNTYGQQIVRESVRSLLTQYSIDQVMENREEISNKLKARVHDRMEGTPLSVLQFGLADVQLPKMILKAKEQAKERQIDIKKAEADKRVRLKEAEANLEVEQKQQQVDLKEAETQVLVREKLGKGVSDAFVTQRWLKIMEKMADNPDGKVFVMPYEAIKNPSMMMGANTEALKELNSRSAKE